MFVSPTLSFIALTTIHFVRLNFSFTQSSPHVFISICYCQTGSTYIVSMTLSTITIYRHLTFSSFFLAPRCHSFRPPHLLHLVFFSTLSKLRRQDLLSLTWPKIWIQRNYFLSSPWSALALQRKSQVSSSQTSSSSFLVSIHLTLQQRLASIAEVLSFTTEFNAFIFLTCRLHDSSNPLSSILEISFHPHYQALVIRRASHYFHNADLTWFFAILLQDWWNSWLRILLALTWQVCEWKISVSFQCLSCDSNQWHIILVV